MILSYRLTVAGVANRPIFVSIFLYNERKDPGPFRGTCNVDCTNSCDQPHCAPKYMKLNLIAVGNLGSVADTLPCGLSSWSKSPVHAFSVHPARRGHHTGTLGQ